MEMVISVLLSSSFSLLFCYSSSMYRVNPDPKSGKPPKRRKTVWIPEETDIALRIVCAKENKTFSEVSQEAYELYLSKKGDK